MVPEIRSCNTVGISAAPTPEKLCADSPAHLNLLIEGAHAQVCQPGCTQVLGGDGCCEIGCCLLLDGEQSPAGAPRNQVYMLQPLSADANLLTMPVRDAWVVAVMFRPPRTQSLRIFTVHKGHTKHQAPQLDLK